jgi:hypothetical protein
MTARSSIRLIGSKVVDGSDVCIVSEDIEGYSPVEIDLAICRVLSRFQSEKSDLESQGVILGNAPQLSVVVAMLDEYRPALNLSRETISCISEINASLDFDPYF